MQISRNTDRLEFMKMHGLGNDFVVIDSRGRSSVVTREMAQYLGDRRRGVGFDQLAEITDFSDTDIALTFWNSDGSVAGACGNATRCVADYVMQGNGTSNLLIKTARGVLAAEMDTQRMVCVNMGQPQLVWEDVPLAQEVDTLHLPLAGDPAAAGMGNPHCVFFVEDVAAVDVETEGSKIEHHALFPKKTNVEFVQVKTRSAARMRVWERGTGITLACGSGACAAVVCGHRRGLFDRKVTLELDGGKLMIDWRDDGVWLSGGTTFVFDGVLPLSQISAEK
jgi:diaminopimelate epimerase